MYSCAWCRRLIKDADDLSARLSRSEVAPSGQLRISASTGFGRRYIATALGDFRRICPDVTIELRLEDGLVDLIHGGRRHPQRPPGAPVAAIRTRTVPSQWRSFDLARTACREDEGIRIFSNAAFFGFSALESIMWLSNRRLTETG